MKPYGSSRKMYKSEKSKAETKRLKKRSRQATKALVQNELAQNEFEQIQITTLDAWQFSFEWGF